MKTSLKGENVKWISVFPVFFLCVSCSSLLEKSGGQEGTEPHWSYVQEDEFSTDLSLILAQKRAVDRILNKDKDPVEEKKNQKKSDSIVKYILDTRASHPKVRKWIKYYCGEDRERFQRFLNRGVRYKKMVQEIFASQGLPPDLYYLGILESGYSKKAVSRAGAVGPWQFMAPTGREYGLRINNHVDERMDPIRSTMAASRYLKELYRQKKSWSLALAAYNAGPGRVRKAIRRGTSKNYWNLTRRRLLPYDTREYVPQFLAILYIGKNLEKFDFHEKPGEGFPFLELVKVPSPLKIAQIAKVTGLSPKWIQKNNPHLLRKITPPGTKSYSLWVKPKNKQLFADNYQTLSRYRLKGLKVRRFISSYRKKRKYYHVKRGDNLSTIARRHGVSLKSLKKINALKSNRIYAGQKIKLRYAGRSSSYRKKRKYYRVKRGDNLSTIARRHGVSLKSLKKINALKSNRIYAGQKIELRHAGRTSSYNRKKKMHRYRIRLGDNLHKISRKFGLTIQQIKKMNNLKTDKIVQGKYLLVASKSGK